MRLFSAVTTLQWTGFNLNVHSIHTHKKRWNIKTLQKWPHWSRWSRKWIISCGHQDFTHCGAASRSDHSAPLVLFTGYWWRKSSNEDIWFVKWHQVNIVFNFTPGMFHRSLLSLQSLLHASKNARILLSFANDLESTLLSSLNQS